MGVRRFGLVALGCIVVLAVLAGGAVASEREQFERQGPSLAVEESDANSSAASSTSPPDPSSDRLGWENGLWYNESIDVDRSDGLNDTELDLVVNRSMARVEQVRKLEFQRTVPVEVIARENLSLGGTPTYPTNFTLAQNVKWEAALMINESRDALSVRQQNRGATVAGYYSPTRNEIVIVSENTSSPKMNEITLSQELFHALQDNQFDITRFDRSTTEQSNAVNGIIEGDGNYVDWLYEQRCDAEWNCLLPNSSGGSGGNTSIHFGMYFVSFQPYSDGPAFVRQLHRNQGWSAVDAVYSAPPESSEQVIHPNKYRNDTPTLPDIDTRPTDGWHALETGYPGPDYAVFGEAGMASMFIYPYYHSGRTATPVLGPFDFLNLDANGTLSSFDPIDYDNRYTSGWNGDKLVSYATADAASTNETGYVWKTEWDSETDAVEFRNGYHDLLSYHGANRTGNHTWRIPDGEEFGDAFWVEQNGSTVTIVNGPTADDLSDIYSGVGGRNTSNSGISALPSASGPPTNLDSDPLLEDVDGDGTGDVFDAIAYYNNRNSAAVQNNPDAFDYDGDGTVGTVFDAIELYNELS